MELIKVYSNIIPFDGFTAFTIWPFVFIREDLKERFTSHKEQHETTHALQQKETLLILFLAIYAVEYLIKLPLCNFDYYRTYRSVSFEQEAHDHESDILYNYIRPSYNWLNYMFTII